MEKMTKKEKAIYECINIMGVRDSLLKKIKDHEAKETDIGYQAFNNGLAIAAHVVYEWFELLLEKYDDK